MNLLRAFFVSPTSFGNAILYIFSDHDQCRQSDAFHFSHFKSRFAETISHGPSIHQRTRCSASRTYLPASYRSSTLFDADRIR